MTLREGVAWVALAGTLFAWAAESFQDGAPPREDGRAVLLAESLATARAEHRAALRTWTDSLSRMGRDTLVRRVVRYIRTHDTAWATHKDSLQVDTVEVVRWLAGSDSTLRVVRDSLEGELVQCRFDAQTCADELAKRPTTCHGWTAFGAGAAVGLALGAAGCAAVR